MWLLIVFLLISLMIILLEAPKLWKRKQKKELLVLLLLLMLGVSYNIAVYTGGRAPNPLDWVTSMVQPISEKITRLLH